MPSLMSLWSRLTRGGFCERGAVLYRRLRVKARGKVFQERCRLIGFPLSLCLGFFLAQHFLLLGLRRSTTGPVGLCNRVVDGRVNADVLILGSSRAYVHFDPAIVERWTGKSCFNIARDGTKPDFQLAFLQTYLRHNRRPEHLVLALDLTSLQGVGGIPNSGLYIAFLNQPEVFAALYQQDHRWLLAKYFPLVAIVQDRGCLSFYHQERERATIEAVRGLLGWHRPEFLRAGYLPVDLEWRKDFDQFKSQNPDGAKVSIDSNAVAKLRSILELCRRLEVKVVLVYPPEYQESQSFCLNRREVFRVFEQLASEFQVPFWDYSNHPLCQKREYFYNSQHLNAKGAALFSEDFAQRFGEAIRPPAQSSPRP
jgi:hypothetical protein